jgi:CubicO group peptidase (beta-lactamase class C family)
VTASQEVSVRRIFSVLVIALLSGYAIRSATLPTLDANAAAAIDRMFQAAVDKGEIPGVVAAVTNKDQIVYLKAFGRQDVARGVAMAG